MEEQRIHQPVGKSIVGHSSRQRVNALAPSVSAVELKTVTQAFGQHCLQRMIRGTSLPQRSADASEVGIQLLTRGGRREEITGRSERGKNHVEIVHPIRLVNGA